MDAEREHLEWLKTLKASDMDGISAHNLVIRYARLFEQLEAIRAAVAEERRIRGRTIDQLRDEFGPDLWTLAESEARKRTDALLASFPATSDYTDPDDPRNWQRDIEEVEPDPASAPDAPKDGMDA